QSSAGSVEDGITLPAHGGGSPCAIVDEPTVAKKITSQRRGVRMVASRMAPEGAWIARAGQPRECLPDSLTASFCSTRKPARHCPNRRDPNAWSDCGLA